MNRQVWWQPALLIFFKFSVVIVFPAIGGALIGQWLDSKFQTDPWLFLTSVGLSFVISISALVKGVLAEYNKASENRKDLTDQTNK